MKNTGTDIQLPQDGLVPAVTELLSFLSYRVQKINQATLLIASYIPDHIAIKNHVINTALMIMSDTHQVELEPEHATVRNILKIATAIRQMKDLFEIAYRGGYTSDMNAKILSTELDSITAFIQEKIMTYCIGDVVYPFRTNQITNSSDNKDITDVLVGILNSDKKTVGTLDTKKTAQENTSIKQMNVSTTVHSKPLGLDTTKSQEVKKESFETSKVFQNKPEAIMYPSTQYSPVKSVSGEDKKERRDAIMRTIRSKGQVTIKDISENINGCSEKTIQRDLQELIQHGVLMREGEKRWAVYKLAMKNV